jgi:hypothetical protein
MYAKSGSSKQLISSPLSSHSPSGHLLPHFEAQSQPLTITREGRNSALSVAVPLPMGIPARPATVLSPFPSARLFGPFEKPPNQPFHQLPHKQAEAGGAPLGRKVRPTTAPHARPTQIKTQPAVNRALSTASRRLSEIGMPAPQAAPDIRGGGRGGGWLHHGTGGPVATEYRSTSAKARHLLSVNRTEADAALATVSLAAKVPFESQSQRMPFSNHASLRPSMTVHRSSRPATASELYAKRHRYQPNGAAAVFRASRVPVSRDGASATDAVLSPASVKLKSHTTAKPDFISKTTTGFW